ncbi:MAG: glycerol-3-phosphate acyltransferase [Chlorobiales bacterium]
MLDYLYLALGAYFIGSIPFAFLLVKTIAGKDVRYEGSGNVGAMNSFDITGSKMLGVLIGVLDALKGTVAVLLAEHHFDGEVGGEDYVKQAATLFVVLGHCYPIWLKFHGGRGLATAAGAAMLFVPSLVIAWCIVWVLAWFYSKKIHFCNISATFCVILIEPIFLPVNYYLFLVLLAGLILLRHRDVMKEAFKGG